MVKYKEFPLISSLTCYIDNVVTLKTASIVTDNSIYDVVGATSKNNGNVGFCDKEELLVKGNLFPCPPKNSHFRRTEPA